MVNNGLSTVTWIFYSMNVLFSIPIMCQFHLFYILFTDPLGVEDKIVMEEPRVGVKNLHLLLTSLDNMRMTVSNVANIVDTVEILKICSFQNSTLLYF